MECLVDMCVESLPYSRFEDLCGLSLLQRRNQGQISVHVSKWS